MHHARLERTRAGIVKELHQCQEQRNKEYWQNMNQATRIIRADLLAKRPLTDMAALRFVFSTEEVVEEIRFEDLRNRAESDLGGARLVF
jgi:hypothetical protein